MITLRYLADQVIRRVAGYAPSSDLEVTKDDVYPYLVQAINEAIKLEIIQIKQQRHDHTPQEASLATFTDVDVIPWEEGLVVGCQRLAFDTDPKEWVEADGDVWVDNDGDSWVISGSTNARLTSSAPGEELYDVVLDQLSLPAGVTVQDIVDFINDADAASYIEFQFTDENIPYRFYRGGISSVVIAGSGVQFSYDLLEIQEAPAEIRSIVRGSALLLKSFSTKDSLTLLGIKRCGSIYGNQQSQKAAAILPVQPVSLELGKGVWRVFDPYDPESQWIPIGTAYVGVTTGADHTGLASFLSGKQTYSWFGQDRIIFNTPRYLMPDKVAIQLVVVSLDQVGEYDPLPIPADYENGVVEEVFKKVLQAGRVDYQVESTTKQ